jgi:hypothetical protein
MKRRGWRRPCIPKRFAALLFPLLLSGFMTLLISGLSIGRVLGLGELLNNPSGFVQTWLQSYLSAWLIAYPILLLVIPVVRRIVDWLTA